MPLKSSFLKPQILRSNPPVVAGGGGGLLGTGVMSNERCRFVPDAVAQTPLVSRARSTCEDLLLDHPRTFHSSGVRGTVLKFGEKMCFSRKMAVTPQREGLGGCAAHLCPPLLGAQRSAAGELADGLRSIRYAYSFLSIVL